MTSFTATSFPLFLTYEEVTAYIGDVPLDDTLMFAGRRVVPAPILAPGLALEEIHEAIRLTERDNVDSLNTTDGHLAFEYAETHLLVIIALAEQEGIRALDAAAYIAQQIFPQLTVLDSTGTAVSTLEALPRHDGVDSVRSIGCRTFLSVSFRRHGSRRAGCRTSSFILRRHRADGPCDEACHPDRTSLHVYPSNAPASALRPVRAPRPGLLERTGPRSHCRCHPPSDGSTTPLMLALSPLSSHVMEAASASAVATGGMRSRKGRNRSAANSERKSPP